MKKTFAGLALRVLRWTPEGRTPDAQCCVVVAAPHTSNWDFFYLILMGWYFDVPIGFVGKHTIFRGPMGTVMRRLGGVPVRRDRPQGLVKQLAEALTEADRLALVIPPEGTRSLRHVWKSGFYRVAEAAQVPIALSYLDYTKKVGGFGLVFDATGDLTADMDLVRDFYAGIDGKHPELFGEIRLAEEKGLEAETA